MLVKLLAGLDRNRFKSVVVSLMTDGTQGSAIRALGIPVHCLNIHPSWPSPLALLRLRSLLRQLQPDVVHGWMYHGGLAAILINSHPVVIIGIRHSIHDIHHEKLAARLIIRILQMFSSSKAVARVVYNATVSAQQHMLLGYPSNKSLIIPNGFNCEHFRPDCDAGKRFLAEIGINEDAFVIGHIARFHPMKAHAIFMRAALMVMRTHPQVHVLLAGRGVVASNPAFVDFVNHPALKNRVHLLGERSDAPDMYNAMDVFCSSSSWGEGFPNVLGEAMACGVPCVATDVGDSAYIIGHTGIVVPPQEAQALAEAWRVMLDMNRQERSKLGQSARNRILAHFSLEAVVRQYELLYETVLDECRRSLIKWNA